MKENEGAYFYICPQSFVLATAHLVCPFPCSLWVLLHLLVPVPALSLIFLCPSSFVHICLVSLCMPLLFVCAYLCSCCPDCHALMGHPIFAVAADTCCLCLHQIQS